MLLQAVSGVVKDMKDSLGESSLRQIKIPSLSHPQSCPCSDRQKRWRQCFVDEHYIPTVLAVEGLDNETDCHGGLLSTDFTVKNSTHPIEYQPEAITSTLCAPFVGPTLPTA